MTQGCPSIPKQRVCAFPRRHIPYQLQVTGRTRVNQHRAFNLSVPNEQRIGHVSGVEPQLGVLEQGARSGEGVIPGTSQDTSYKVHICAYTDLLDTATSVAARSSSSMVSWLTNSSPNMECQVTVDPVEECGPESPAFSFQYLRMTGSIGTPSNSSVMHWTSNEVEWDLLPLAGIDISAGEKKVSGTRIMAGLCICI